MSASPSLGWDLFWLELVQSLFMLYLSLRVHVCISSVVSRGHYFLGVIYRLNLLQCVPCRSLSLEGRGFGLDVLLRAECSKVHFLCTVQLWTSSDYYLLQEASLML